MVNLVSGTCFVGRSSFVGTALFSNNVVVCPIFTRISVASLYEMPDNL